MTDKRDSQFTRDKNRFNYVSRKVFDRKVDQIERRHTDLKQRFRELQALIGEAVADSSSSEED